MKNFILSFTALILVLAASAQNSRYIQAMKTNIAALDSGMIKNNMQALANNFERIAEAEKTQWLPYYYAAYATVMSSFALEDKSKVDAVADKAEALINKAEAVAGKENDETLLIRSMVASSHLMLNPQARYMKYSTPAASNIAKAKAINPSNPRAFYLDGQTKFYTPEALGGGKAPAKETFTKAMQMFDTFKPESELHPTWGKSLTAYFLAQCN